MHFCPRDVWWIRNSYGSGSVHRDIAIKRAAHRHFLQTTFENTCYALNFASINHNRRSAYIYIVKEFRKSFEKFRRIFNNFSFLSLSKYIYLQRKFYHLSIPVKPNRLFANVLFYLATILTRYIEYVLLWNSNENRTSDTTILKYRTSLMME